MATHSNVLAWRIPGAVEPGRLPSMGLHRVRHDWSDLAAAAAAAAVWLCRWRGFGFDFMCRGILFARSEQGRSLVCWWLSYRELWVKLTFWAERWRDWKTLSLWWCPSLSGLANTEASLTPMSPVFWTHVFMSFKPLWTGFGLMCSCHLNHFELGFPSLVFKIL